MRYKPSANDLSNECRQVRRDHMHLVQQVCVKLVPVLSQADDSPSEGFNVDQVNGADVLTHGGLGSFQNVLGLVLICSDLCHLCQLHTQEKKSKVYAF